MSYEETELNPQSFGNQSWHQTLIKSINKTSHTRNQLVHFSIFTRIYISPIFHLYFHIYVSSLVNYLKLEKRNKAIPASFQCTNVHWQDAKRSFQSHQPHWCHIHEWSTIKSLHDSFSIHNNGEVVNPKRIHGVTLKMHTVIKKYKWGVLFLMLINKTNLCYCLIHFGSTC